MIKEPFTHCVRQKVHLVDYGFPSWKINQSDASKGNSRFIFLFWVPGIGKRMQLRRKSLPNATNHPLIFISIPPHPSSHTTPTKHPEQNPTATQAASPHHYYGKSLCTTLYILIMFCILLIIMLFHYFCSVMLIQASFIFMILTVAGKVQHKFSMGV